MSSDLSKQYHSVIFRYINQSGGTIKELNTWDDWHLVPTSRPLFSQPTQKTQYIDIPGADGSIDLTESLTPYPVYNNRTGSLEFIVMNGYESWDVKLSMINNFLHGKKMRAILEDDPSYYYEGRFTVNNWKSNNNGTWSNITIDYNVAPYKTSLLSTVDDWLWDPFSFETGIIYPSYFKSIALDDSNIWQYILLYTGLLSTTIGNKPVVPKVIVSGLPSGCSVQIQTYDSHKAAWGRTYWVNANGTYTNAYSIMLGPHISRIGLRSNGACVVSLDFHPGSL